MRTPILELPKTFVLYSNKDNFIEIQENRTHVEPIEDIEGRKYVGIRVFGRQEKTFDTIIIDIFLDKDAAGEYIHKSFRYNTSLHPTEYRLTRKTLLQIIMKNFDLIFCSSFLLTDGSG
ncbi:hypothetical protein [Acinetobacter haemolyticus]|uniref:hypothetical protein n=1 Tax=Acinetobacter haemolyticus TaxID=29430 RepID=UPI0002D095D4|nr:hypothetical protein [Acinetobacter haemolyticus]ENW19119.1 hypothetical protein F926_02679 [Acinetobacter haemolyticus NIPH 261]NAR67701.1 hypothetical protein [Acinetobacter haemolyticus]NAR84325.1 hypothetical protein [Acinetobacter haemolyticus]